MSGNKHLFKKSWLVLVTILLLFVVTIFNCAIADEIKNPLAIDMVIAIDNNVFMNHHDKTLTNRLDPDGLRFDAAAALISMCDAQYSRAGFFLFSDNLYTYTENGSSYVKPITSDAITLYQIDLLRQRPQRLNLLNELNSDSIRNGYGTKKGVEIGKALSAAVDAEIMNKDIGNRKVILLLSSGRVDVSNTSAEEARRAKEKAVNNSIEIYTVALTENSKLLQELATQPSNYQCVANATDLIDVYRTFFADMIGSNPSETGPAIRLGDGKSQVQLKIPNESVSEVNLIIPLEKMKELELVDPDGKVISSTDDSVLINQSRNFCTYKLIHPKADTYRLNYSSDEEQDIAVQYVFSYSVQVFSKVNSNTISKHLPVTITAGYLENNAPTKDLKLYNIPARISLWKENRLIVPEKVMSLNEKQDAYSFTYDNLKQYGAGNYTAKITFDGDGLLRESEVSFTLVNDNPVLIDKNRNGESFKVTINEPQKSDTYNVALHTKHWDLNDFVQDINNDTLTAEIVSVPENVDARCNGMVLSVTPKKNTPADEKIVVVVKDSDGGESENLTFPVKVTNYEDRYKDYTAKFDAIKKLEKNSSQKLSLKIYNKDGAVVKDKEHLPETVTAIIKVNSEQREAILSINENGFWEGELQTDITTADYEVNAEIAISDQVMITADSLTISSTNRAPELKPGAKALDNWIISINDPGDSSSYDVKNKTWKLLDLIRDLDGDDITFEVDKDASCTDIDILYNKETKELTLTTKKDQEANGNIIIHCWDNEKLAGPDLTFHVKVSSIEEIYKQYTAKLEVDGRGKNKDITIFLSVYNEKGILVQQDNNMPDSINASYIVNSTQTVLPLSRREDGKWSGTLHTADKVIVYTVKAAVQISKNISIQPEDLQISTQNRKPEVIANKEINLPELIPTAINIDPFLFWNQETGEIVFEDLNEFFMDPDGDKLTFDFGNKNLGDCVDASIEGNKLTINGFKETSDLLSFTITATDNEGLQAESELVQFSVKSLKKQGVKTIILIIAAIIALFILYNICKPGFHNQFFEVSTKRDGGVELTQGKSGVLKGKKPVRLGGYSTANAKSFCQASLPVPILNEITIHPAYGNRVKLKVDGKSAAQIKIGSNMIDKKKGGILSPNGVLTVAQNGISLMFRLKQAGTRTAPRGANHNTPSIMDKTPVSTQIKSQGPKRTGRT